MDCGLQSEEWSSGCLIPYDVLCCARSLSRVQLFATPWTVTHQAPLSMAILQARILEWLPCPPPGNLPNLGIKPRSSTMQADSLSSEPSGKLNNTRVDNLSLLQGIFLTQESDPGVFCNPSRFFSSSATREAHTLC